jgi:hypothetical protein
LPDDFAGHASTGHGGLSDQHAAVPMHETDLVEGHRSSDVTGEPLDLHHTSRLDSVLLPSCFNDRVHVLKSSL